MATVEELSKTVAQQVKLDDERAHMEGKMIVLFEAIHLEDEAQWGDGRISQHPLRA